MSSKLQSYGYNNQNFMNNYAPINSRMGGSMSPSQNMLNLSTLNNNNMNNLNVQKNFAEYEVDIDVEKTTRDLLYIGGNKDKFDQYMKKLNRSVLGDNELEKNQEEKIKYMQKMKTPQLSGNQAFGMGNPNVSNIQGNMPTNPK